MEDKLKDGFELTVSKNDKGRLIGSYVKRNDPSSIAALIELSPEEEQYINSLASIKQNLGYSEHLALRYSLDTFSYEVAIEKKKTEGPYCEFDGWQTVEKKEHPVLACAMKDLEDSIGAGNIHQTITQSEELNIFQMVKEGYQLCISQNQIGEIVGGLMLTENEQYKNYIALDEKSLAFVYDIKAIKEQIRNGKVFDLSYQKETNSFVAMMKERHWEEIKSTNSQDVMEAIISLNNSFMKEEGEKVYGKK